MADGKKAQVLRAAPTGQTVETMAGRIAATERVDDVAVPRMVLGWRELLVVELPWAAKTGHLLANRWLLGARYSSIMLAYDAAVIQTFAIGNKLALVVLLDHAMEESLLLAWIMMEVVNL